MGLGIKVNNPITQDYVNVYWNYNENKFKINTSGMSLTSLEEFEEFKTQLLNAESFVKAASLELGLKF